MNLLHVLLYAAAAICASDLHLSKPTVLPKRSAFKSMTSVEKVRKPTAA